MPLVFPIGEAEGLNFSIVENPELVAAVVGVAVLLDYCFLILVLPLFDLLLLPLLLWALAVPACQALYLLLLEEYLKVQKIHYHGGDYYEVLC